MASQSRLLGCSRLRVLASPSYLKAHVTAKSVEELSRHNLLGFTQPDSLNQWPLRHAFGDSWSINPSLSAASGELLLRDRVEVRQPVHAVYYRNTALASCISCFLDYLSSQLATSLPR